MEIRDQIDNYKVFIVTDDETNQHKLTINLVTPDLMLLDHSYINAVALSADLACTIGTGTARELLLKHNVPKTSRLWHLNHARC